MVETNKEYSLEQEDSRLRPMQKTEKEMGKKMKTFCPRVQFETESLWHKTFHFVCFGFTFQIRTEKEGYSCGSSSSNRVNKEKTSDLHLRFLSPLEP